MPDWTIAPPVDTDALGDVALRDVLGYKAGGGDPVATPGHDYLFKYLWAYLNPSECNGAYDTAALWLAGLQGQLDEGAAGSRVLVGDLADRPAVPAINPSFYIAYDAGNEGVSAYIGGSWLDLGVGVSAFIKTLLGAADAATALATLGAVGASGQTGAVDLTGAAVSVAAPTAAAHAATKAYVDASLPIGAELLYPADTPPTGFMVEDGSLLVCVDYPELLAVFLADDIHYGLSAGAAFTADAGTDLITSAGHGLADDDVVVLSNSGGALPAGLAAKTMYYVVGSTTDTFQLSATEGGAALDITGAGTGTHKWHDEYRLPGPGGRGIRITDDGAGVDLDAATRTDRGDGVTGDAVGTNQADQVAAHTHGVAYYGDGSRSGAATLDGPGGGAGSHTTTSYGGLQTNMRNTGRRLIIRAY